MTRRGALTVAVATCAVAALGAAGCGIDDPYVDSGEDAGATGASGPTAAPSRAEAFTEARAAGPEKVLTGAALAYGNWTSETVAGAYRTVAALTAGEARAQIASQAKQMEASVEQTAEPLRSRATVEGVLVRGDAPRLEAIVVTRESVRGPGIPDEGDSYRVTLAALERRAGRWLITSWVPQP